MALPVTHPSEFAVLHYCLFANFDLDCDVEFFVFFNHGKTHFLRLENISLYLIYKKPIYSKTLLGPFNLIQCLKMNTLLATYSQFPKLPIFFHQKLCQYSFGTTKLARSRSCGCIESLQF